MSTPGSGHLTHGTELTQGEFSPGQGRHLKWAWEFQGHLIGNVLNFVLRKVMLYETAYFAVESYLIYLAILRAWNLMKERFKLSSIIIYNTYFQSWLFGVWNTIPFVGLDDALYNLTGLDADYWVSMESNKSW